MGGDVEWHSDWYVMVHGECYEGPLSAAGHDYCVLKEDGGWLP